MKRVNNGKWVAKSVRGRFIARGDANESKKERGFVLVAAMVVIFVLSTMSYFAVQHTGYSMFLTATQRDNSMLEATAQACLDLVMMRCRDQEALCISNAMNVAALPRLDGSDAARTIRNPLIGDAFVIRQNCVAGGVSPHCVCRTGYLYDFDGLYFNYDITNPLHTTIADNLPSSNAGGPPIGGIIRYGSPIGHVFSRKSGPFDGDESMKYNRWYIWFAVAVNKSAREYQMILEGGPYPDETKHTN